MELFIIGLLLCVGIVLLILEIFFIPGFGITGLGGVFFASGAIYTAYVNMGMQTAIITGIVGIILFLIVFIYFLRSNAWDKLSLKTKNESKIETEVKEVHVGDKGITISRLAPMGLVRVLDFILEAKAEDELIDENTEIIVTAINSSNITVKRI